MSSLFDRMKDSLQAAGKSARKISDVANRKVDLWDARKTLEARYEALGKAVAHRLIERDERTVDRAEDAIATLIDELRAAREKVDALERSLSGESEPVTEVAEIEVRTETTSTADTTPKTGPKEEGGATDVGDATGSSEGRPGELPSEDDDRTRSEP